LISFEGKKRGSAVNALHFEEAAFEKRKGEGG